jgi:predicted site-specific integrase-resolvase
MEHKVERVIIAYKDRLSRVGFDLFHYFSRPFGTEITVVSEVGNHKLDSEEVFEEIAFLLHCYSMKMYNKRNKTKMEVGFDAS